MGRGRRIVIPNGVYHVFARGNRKDPIFRTDFDMDQFLLYVGDEVTQRGWRCLSYCLIPNHYHFAFETPEPNLSLGMHRLNLRWAKCFNRQYVLVGHVFQGRFGSTTVRDERHLAAVIRYIARNPVEAGLCDDPREWEWSSCAEVFGNAPLRLLVDFDRMCELVGVSTANGRAWLEGLIAG